MHIPISRLIDNKNHKIRENNYRMEIIYYFEKIMKSDQKKKNQIMMNYLEKIIYSFFHKY